ncbi:hypothetical protein AAZX31_07G159300 [Glycine max]
MVFIICVVVMSRKENLISELHTRKGTWKIAMRITDLWQARKQNSKQTIEMVLMDQTGSKIGATLWQELFTELRDKLQCGSSYLIQNLRIVDNQSEYRVSPAPYLVYLLKTTSVKEIHHPEIPSNVYLITPFTDIISGLAPCHTLVGKIKDATGVSGVDKYPLSVQNIKFGSKLYVNADITEIHKFRQRYKLNVRIEHNGDKGNFLLWDATCIKLFGKTAGECRDELIAAGDDIKVFPKCVDEILLKTWAVRFKFRSQLRQSSVLDVSEELHHIQSLIATLGLKEQSSKGKGIVVEPESSPPIFVPTLGLLFQYCIMSNIYL